VSNLCIPCWCCQERSQLCTNSHSRWPCQSSRYQTRTETRHSRRYLKTTENGKLNTALQKRNGYTLEIKEIWGRLTRGTVGVSETRQTNAWRWRCIERNIHNATCTVLATFSFSFRARCCKNNNNNHHYLDHNHSRNYNYYTVTTWGCYT